VSLIGHDWGAAVAWRLAMKYPERLQKLVILNVPHPSVMLAHLRHNWAQKRRSWYMLFFQLPWIPELVARAGNWHLLARTMTATYQPGTFNETDLKRYRQAWSQPGAFTAMLNWYRAGLRRRAKPTSQPRISVPTLMIWGVHDVALGREMAQPSIDYCDNGRLVFIEEATHWVQHDAPERVNKLLQEFLAD
jgi:pimeloyl-ACP methyl ester carboxylesterase